MRTRLGAGGRARSNAMVSVGGALFGQGLVLLTGVLAARILGVEGRGHLALLWVVALSCSLVLTLGLPLAVTYEVAADHGATRSVLRTIRRPVIGQIVAALLAQVALLGLLVGGDGSTVLAAAAISITVVPSMFVLVYAMAILQGLERFREWTTARIAPVFLYAVGAVATWAAGVADLVVLSIAWSLGYLLAALYAAERTRRALPPASDTEVRFADMQRFGGKAFVSATTPSETLNIDQMLVGGFISASALGLYVAAVAFTNLPRAVGQSLGYVAFPYVARQAGNDQRRRAVWRVGLAAGAILAVIVLVLIPAAGTLVPALFGADFRDAVGPTRLLLVAALLISVRRVLADAARGAGRPGLGSIAELVATGVLVVLMIVLSGPYGLDGVAVALIIASAVGLLVIVGGLLRGVVSVVPDPAPSSLAGEPPATG